MSSEKGQGFISKLSASSTQQPFASKWARERRRPRRRSAFFATFATESLWYDHLFPSLSFSLFFCVCVRLRSSFCARHGHVDVTPSFPAPFHFDLAAPLIGCKNTGGPSEAEALQMVRSSCFVFFCFLYCTHLILITLFSRISHICNKKMISSHSLRTHVVAVHKMPCDTLRVHFPLSSFFCTILAESVFWCSVCQMP